MNPSQTTIFDPVPTPAAADTQEISPERLRAIDAAKRYNKAESRPLAALVRGDELFFCPCDKDGAPKGRFGYRICDGTPTPHDPDPAFALDIELWLWSSWDETKYAGAAEKRREVLKHCKSSPLTPATP